ncbi:MAG TPA: DUF4238 domain-containing protein [Candidatus Acidoferrum sp.]|jgi:hypothetical protein|nr:DUF4238 domain-containing protein [Candidatus Acidoferrum sp.]
MPQTTEIEPRAHHYVPQCWLAGFTDSGQKDGRLWVTDFNRRKQWPTTPPNAGHQRDFYRVSSPVHDPVIVEKLYSKIEDGVAPILKSLDEELRGPTEQELEGLCVFMAIQWTRVPAFRPKMLSIVDTVERAAMKKALKSPASWKKVLKNLNQPLDSAEADYHKMREFVESGQYSLSADTEWYVQQSLEGAQAIAPSLMKRHWQASVSRNGSFIASDNPVALDGEKRQRVGFTNAPVVIFPVSRHIVLHGTLSKLEPLHLTGNAYCASEHPDDAACSRAGVL